MTDRITQPLAGIIMGSKSDLTTLQHAADVLKELDVAYEIKIVSAHRTPLRMVEYAKDAQARGIKVIIAGAGGAAHLPGMVASLTSLPVLGVPVGTLAIGESGAVNAALLAVSILGLSDAAIQKRYEQYRQAATKKVEMEVI